MRPIFVVAALLLPACGLAQGINTSCIGGGTSGGSQISGQGCLPGRPLEIGNLQITLRTDPPSAAFPPSLTFSYRGLRNAGESYFSRTLMDSVNHVYLGYEMLLEEQQPGTYLATFGKLNASPMEAAASAGSKLKEWPIQTLPAIPEPRVVHDGEKISLELMTDAVTGAKLIEDIEFRPFSPRPSPQPVTSQPLIIRQLSAFLPNVITYAGIAPNRISNGPVPTVSGTPRDFSAADAEMQILQPRVTLNGMPQSTATRGTANVHGSLVWFYLPGHGRYILSIAPRPDLDFRLAGELRGGAVTFTWGTDSIKLECSNAIATGDAPYNLYVAFDPEWEPTAQAQKGLFATGSVSPGELASLKRK